MKELDVVLGSPATLVTRVGHVNCDHRYGSQVLQRPTDPEALAQLRAMERLQYLMGRLSAEDVLFEAQRWIELESQLNSASNKPLYELGTAGTFIGRAVLTGETLRTRHDGSFWNVVGLTHRDSRYDQNRVSLNTLSIGMPYTAPGSDAVKGLLTAAALEPVEFLSALRAHEVIGEEAVPNGLEMGWLAFLGVDHREYSFV